MQKVGDIRIDPVAFDSSRSGVSLEVVVPYTEWSVTDAVLKRAVDLAAGLDVTITLVAVHTVPYAAGFGCPAVVHAHLVEQLVDLAAHCPLPVTPQVVLARDPADGLKFVLKPESTVLVGSRRHFWRTAEEKLARSLAASGHKVALLYVE